MKPPVRIAAALAMSAGVALAPTAAVAAPTAAEGSAVAAFTRVAQWSAGYVGHITVRNDSAATVNGWRVEFDLPAGTRITSSFSGVFTSTGNHHVVTNPAWNPTLSPGSSATFGWVAQGQGTPENCTLNGFDCAGAPADFTAPARPGPLAFDIRDGLTLTWAPSTDDQGPVTYEVYESSQLRATVTDTRYVYSNGPALPPRIYVFAVRAVDSAGNVSPYSYRSLGQIWRGDEVPEAPSDLRVDTPAAGLLRLRWTGPAAQSPFAAPPTAGYQVYLDGEPVGQVGGTTITVPVPPAGEHTFAVRTINAVDRYSTPAELTHVVS